MWSLFGHNNLQTEPLMKTHISLYQLFSKSKLMHNQCEKPSIPCTFIAWGTPFSSKDLK